MIGIGIGMGVGVVRGRARVREMEREMERGLLDHLPNTSATVGIGNLHPHRFSRSTTHSDANRHLIR